MNNDKGILNKFNLRLSPFSKIKVNEKKKKNLNDLFTNYKAEIFDKTKKLVLNDIDQFYNFQPIKKEQKRIITMGKLKTKSNHLTRNLSPNEILNKIINSTHDKSKTIQRQCPTVRHNKNELLEIKPYITKKQDKLKTMFKRKKLSCETIRSHLLMTNLNNFSPTAKIHKSRSQRNMLTTRNLNYKLFHEVTSDSIKELEKTKSAIFSEYNHKPKTTHIDKKLKEYEEITTPEIPSKNYKSALRIFRNKKTEKDAFLTQASYNLLTFGDCFYRMNDIDFYQQRKHIIKQYPQVRKDADIDMHHLYDDSPKSKKENKMEVNYYTMYRLMKESQDMLEKKHQHY